MITLLQSGLSVHCRYRCASLFAFICSHQLYSHAQVKTCKACSENICSCVICVYSYMWVNVCLSLYGAHSVGDNCWKRTHLMWNGVRFICVWHVIRIGWVYWSTCSKGFALRTVRDCVIIDVPKKKKKKLICEKLRKWMRKDFVFTFLIFPILLLLLASFWLFIFFFSFSLLLLALMLFLNSFCYS